MSITIEETTLTQTKPKRSTEKKDNKEKEKAKAKAKEKHADTSNDLRMRLEALDDGAENAGDDAALSQDMPVWPVFEFSIDDPGNLRVLVNSDSSLMNPSSLFAWKEAPDAVFIQDTCRGFFF